MHKKQKKIYIYIYTHILYRHTAKKSRQRDKGAKQGNLIANGVMRSVLCRDSSYGDIRSKIPADVRSLKASRCYVNVS